MTFQTEMVEAIPELREAYAAFEWPHLRTICVEALLPPLLVKLGQDRTKLVRLAQILKWIESIAGGADVELRNLIGISVCQPLITTYSDYFFQLEPYLGRKTRELCRMQFEIFKIDPKTRQLLGGKKT